MARMWVGCSSYIGPKRRPKVVRYWAMEVVGGELAFEHEVDTGRWVSVEEAEELLSYRRDVEVLRDASRTSA